MASLRLIIIPYNLKLLTAFGTSHSSTTSRVNALFLILFNGELQGVSETGLPPKKLHSYEADLTDLVTYAKSFVESLVKVLS